jgi:glucose-1-phosphate thymidylyltransferase
MLSGIREILIINSPGDTEKFKNVLGDGADLGLKINYLVQERPEGIAQAFSLAEEFIGTDSAALILGDNFFYGAGLSGFLREGLKNFGCRVFLYEVANPSDYGVVELSHDSIPISVEEKPQIPKSNFAVTGLYFFDNKVSSIANKVKPSARGELEITDVISRYIEDKDIVGSVLLRGMTWLDTGTPNSLHDASSFVRVIEERTSQKIGCIEEVAFRNKWVDREDLLALAAKYGESQYANYLVKIAKE